MNSDCEYFIKYKGLIWDKEYLTQCDVCVHQDKNLDCKVNGINNKTALVHE